jgi:hypothetical protein
VPASGDHVDPIQASGAAVKQLYLKTGLVEVVGTADREQLLGGVLDKGAECLR